MKTKMLPLSRIAKALALAGLVTAALPALAIDYYLRADTVDMPMPGGASVPMWGFALDGASCVPVAPATTCPVTVPGPMLTVPPGEGLRVVLANNLTEPVSIVIPGQSAAMTPVWTDNTIGPRTSPAQRVRSFTHEAAPNGGIATYEWPNLRAGTYLYHSGTHPQVQVQMGLYGGAAKNAAASEAYAGVAYDNELTLLFSEVDPLLHQAVSDGTYGTAAAPETGCLTDFVNTPNGVPGKLTSTLCYRPQYFLINGKPFEATAPILARLPAGQRTLLRFINAGLQTHVPVLNGAHLTLVAEDGNPYRWPREQYSVPLPAAKTTDALFTPQTGFRYPLFDRRLNLTNAGMADGGMFAILAESSAPGTTPRITSTAVTSAREGQPYSYQVAAVDPDDTPLVFSLVTMPPGMTISGTGLIDWTPVQGTYAVEVHVADQTGLFATQAFSIAVAPPNDRPTAAPDAYSIVQGHALSVTSPGVLGNDIDPEGDAMTAVLASAPASGTLQLFANGGFTYSGGALGAQSFSYRARDAVGNLSDPATVAIDVTQNSAPTAGNDAYTAVLNNALTVAAPGVLGNDSDVDGDAITAVLESGPAGLTLNADGSFTYSAAAAGPQSFTYRARDAFGNLSAVATVSIDVQTDLPPVAQNDAYVTVMKALLTVPAPGILANDIDPDGGPLTALLVRKPSKGGLTLNADGSFTYKTDATGQWSFDYQVRDISGKLSNVATVNLEVRANTAPVAVPDSYTVAARFDATYFPENLPVVDNDYDPDTQYDPANYISKLVLVSAPNQKGKVSKVGTSFDYTPALNFIGTETFTYRVEDTRGGKSNTVTVTITVE